MNYRYLIAAFAVMAAAPAGAATFSYSGDFTRDDDVVLVGFELLADSTVTFQSFSYAGGTQADGTTVSAGGFDPILGLYDSSGDLITYQDDRVFDASAPTDPVTGQQYDVFYSTDLLAGSYTFTLSQYDSYPRLTLDAGFSRDGDGNFTAVFGCSNGSFCDYTGDNRTAFYAFDLIGVDSVEFTAPGAVVPLPAGLPLLAGGLGALAILRRRSHRPA